MAWILSLVTLALLLFFLLLPACRGAGKDPGTPPAAPGAAPQAGKVAGAQAPATGGLTREQIAEKLKTLRQAPKPADLKMGALCYEMAAPPNRAEYVCPVCHEKTLYAVKEGGASYTEVEFVLHQIDGCRRLAKNLPGLAASVDEREFCRKCSPKLEHPALVLVFRLAGETSERRFRGISPEDLTILAAFLAGKDRYDDGPTGEVAIRDCAARIEEILLEGE
jgi:hypothetical protein